VLPMHFAFIPQEVRVLFPIEAMAERRDPPGASWHERHCVRREV
jgi:hypothetical protein